MGLLKAMIEYLNEHEDNGHPRQTAEPEKSAPPQKAELSPSVYYIATDLEHRKLYTADNQDIECDGKVYRKLTSDYFAWLRSRIVLARNAHKNGKMHDADWNVLRDRFNSVQEIAIREFGNDTLEDAVRTLNPKTYQPPTVAKNETVPAVPDYPGDKSYKFTQPVTREALAKVNAIRDEAMAKDWSEAKLYQNQGRFKFPCGQDYGLICFLDDECEIGEVTKQSIEIKHGANSLRFYNPDVEQPWIRRISDGN